MNILAVPVHSQDPTIMWWSWSASCILVIWQQVTAASGAWEVYKLHVASHTLSIYISLLIIQQSIDFFPPWYFGDQSVQRRYSEWLSTVSEEGAWKPIGHQNIKVEESLLFVTLIVEYKRIPNRWIALDERHTDGDTVLCLYLESLMSL